MKSLGRLAQLLMLLLNLPDILWQPNDGRRLEAE